jgi:hypothetical protein
MTLASVALIVLLLLRWCCLRSRSGYTLQTSCRASRSGRCAWERASKPFAYRLAGTRPGRRDGLEQRLQAWLPLNPQHFANVSPDSAFNTAVSFITNTNWQGYSGESTHELSHADGGTRRAELPVRRDRHRVAIALIRGFARHSTKTIGNFWVDMTRCTLYLLLPLSRFWPSCSYRQGVVQNFAPTRMPPTIETLTYQNPKTDAAGNPLVDAAGNPVTRRRPPAPRPCRWARSPRRRRSRSSAPTAADSSMRTPRIRMRTPRP